MSFSALGTVVSACRKKSEDSSALAASRTVEISKEISWVARIAASTAEPMAKDRS